MQMTLGPVEIALILGAAVLLIGPNKLPEIARSIGEAMREYKRGLSGVGNPTNPKGTIKKVLTEDERIREEAKKLGIPVDGRSVDEIAQDILNLKEA